MEGGRDRHEQQQQGDMEMQQEAERRRQMIKQLPNKQCPRCYSQDTKFCYFNNNKLYQERYYCKRCKKHWTHGGTVRKLPGPSALPNPTAARAFISSGGGPYMVRKVYSLDQLFGFNPAETQASGSSIPQAPVAAGNVTNLSYAHNPAVVGAHNQGQSRQLVQERRLAYEDFRAHQNNPIGNSAGSQTGGSFKNIPQASSYHQQQLNTGGVNVNNLSNAQVFRNGLTHMYGLQAHNQGEIHQPVRHREQFYQDNSNESLMAHRRMAFLQSNNQGQSNQPIQARAQFYQQYADQGFGAHKSNHAGPFRMDPSGICYTGTGASSSDNELTGNENILRKDDDTNSQLDCTGSFSGWPSNIDWSRHFPGNNPPEA